MNELMYILELFEAEHSNCCLFFIQIMGWCWQGMECFNHDFHASMGTCLLIFSNPAKWASLSVRVCRLVTVKCFAFSSTLICCTWCDYRFEPEKILLLWTEVMSNEAWNSYRAGIYETLQVSGKFSFWLSECLSFSTQILLFELLPSVAQSKIHPTAICRC